VTIWDYRGWIGPRPSVRAPTSAVGYLLPLPDIVHAMPNASRAATPSLRDAYGTLDPSDPTRNSGIYEEARREVSISHT